MLDTMQDAEQNAHIIGPAMYEKIRAEMEARHWGKMVVIDVHSGDYEVDDDDMTAILRLLERRPYAFTWGERAGYPVPYYMGDRITGALLGWPRYDD